MDKEGFVLTSISVMNPETIGVEWREESFFQNMNTKIDYSKAAYLLMGVRAHVPDFLYAHANTVATQEIERAWGDEYAKPKHHYALHIPFFMWMLGPCKGWWCMRFEAKHQW